MLTCHSTNMPEEKIGAALEGAKKAGISNIVALRGGAWHVHRRISREHNRLDLLSCAWGFHNFSRVARCACLTPTPSRRLCVAEQTRP